MKNNKKKDVLFLCQYFYPEYISSATLPYETAEMLVKYGYSVGALCGYPKEYNQFNDVPITEKINEIDIHRLKYIQLKRSNFWGRLINYFSFTLAVLFHIVKLKEYKIILVYSNPPILPLIAVIAKKLFKSRIIFVSYDVYPEIAVESNIITKDSIIYRLFCFINSKLYNNVDKVVAVSTDMERFLLNNRKIKQNKIITIPNWCEEIDSSRLHPAAETEDKLIVSYLGNLGTCQELDTLLGAIRILKDNSNIQFVFAGHGNKMERLETITRTEKLNNVTIYGFLHGDEFEHILYKSDVFVVTLIPGLAGLCAPSKTYTYIMAGKPLISVMEENTEIVKDLMEKNAGFNIHYGDSQFMSNKIKLLYDDKKLREQMGNNSRDLFLKKYTKEICTLKYVEVIKNELEDSNYV